MTDNNMIHILESQQFDELFLYNIFTLTTEIREKFESPSGARFFGGVLGDKTLATLFYEPSTRTRFSFESAMQKLGGSVISTENANEFSSAAKGESLKDTIRVVSGYADAIVLRHPEENSSRVASQVSSVPIVNAGAGGGQHPTQALIDLYAILKHKYYTRELQVALVGDMCYSRTVHSLIYLLAKVGVKHLYFVEPEFGVDIETGTALPRGLVKYLAEHNISWSSHRTLHQVSTFNVDVYYMTRPQKERYVHVTSTERIDLSIDIPVVRYMNRNAIVLHPLPRNEEIPSWFDEDGRAKYFEQARDGLYLRMVLLLLVNGALQGSWGNYKLPTVPISKE